VILAKGKRTVYSVILWLVILVGALFVGRSDFWNAHFPPSWLERGTGLQKRIYYGLVGAFKASVMFALMTWLIFFMPEFWSIVPYILTFPAIGFVLGFALGEAGS